MAARTDAYVDTAALVAFADGSDTHHDLFRRLFANPPRLVTTPLVIAEGHGWFLRRFDASRALQFLAMVEAIAPLNILPAGDLEVACATKYLRKFSDQNLTMADALGLHYMKELRILTCWSTDRHMTLTGVALVTG